VVAATRRRSARRATLAGVSSASASWPSMKARAQDQRSPSPVWIVGGGCWPVRRVAAAPAGREAGNLKVMHVAAIAVLVGIIVAPGDL
jgi:hypothetical protein